MYHRRMTTRLLFVGAGAIGSYLGAFLSRAGHDVTLVDPWPEQVEAIRRGGIAATGPHEPFTARPTALHLHEAQRLGADFDIAFVAVKSYDTAWATHVALRHLAPSGYAVAAQNCWNDPVVAAIAGPARSVGLIMSRIAVALWEPGRVERGVEKGAGAGHVVFRPGEHDGWITPRVEELARMLSVIDGARPTDNLWGERWAKLCANCMGNPVQAMSGRPAVYKELDTMLMPREGAGRNWRASMAQDVIKGRRTEIAYMNGHVVSKGKETGIPTPVSAAVVGLVEEIDAGARKPAREHIELALRHAGF